MGTSFKNFKMGTLKNIRIRKASDEKHYPNFKIGKLFAEMQFFKKKVLEEKNFYLKNRQVFERSILKRVPLQSNSESGEMMIKSQEMKMKSRYFSHSILR